MIYYQSASRGRSGQPDPPQYDTSTDNKANVRNYTGSFERAISPDTKFKKKHQCNTTTKRKWESNKERCIFFSASIFLINLCLISWDSCWGCLSPKCLSQSPSFPSRCSKPPWLSKECRWPMVNDELWLSAGQGGSGPGYSDLPAPTLYLLLFAAPLALSLILAPKRALLQFELSSDNLYVCHPPPCLTENIG